MKICLICGAQAPDDAPFCDQCGEASWQEPEAPPVDGEASAPQDGAAEPEDGPVEAPEGAPTDTPRVPRRRRVPPS